MSCGEDVGGDEIVFVLEQADEREAGQHDPGRLGGTQEVGALAVAGSEGLAACVRSRSAMGSLTDVYEPGMAAGADAVQPGACR